MPNIIEVVDLLEDKMRILLERFEFLKEENELLHNNIVQLQQELVTKEQLLVVKQSDLETVKVAKTIQGSNNTRETTQTINTLIKEIDWCISQLND